MGNKVSFAHDEWTAPDFHLNARVLRFCQLRITDCALSNARCAELAGYSASSANTRAKQLMRDPRVMRALLFHGLRQFRSSLGEVGATAEALAQGKQFMFGLALATPQLLKDVHGDMVRLERLGNLLVHVYNRLRLDEQVDAGRSGLEEVL